MARDDDRRGERDVPSAGPIVRLEGVNKVFDDGVRTHVLHDVSLELYPGEFASIQGASGSGKSTLLNLIGLLDTPTWGRITLGERDVSQLSDDERAALRRDYLGFIFQFHYLLPEFNVLENALMPCRLRGRAAELACRDRVVALLEEVGLGDRLTYRPAQLSGGQQQRVAVVRALANDPVLVLADEPTGNLDRKSGEAVFALMTRLKEHGGTAFLMVSHDEALTRRTDRVLTLVDGRLQPERGRSGDVDA